MLALYVTDMSQTELQKLVADHCSDFGSGTVLRVLPPDERGKYGVALVEMSSSREAANLARTIGDSQYGPGLVAIRLVYGENAAPRNPVTDTRPSL